MSAVPVLSASANDRGETSRLRLSGLALVYTVLAVPALALLVLITVSLSVSLVGVGLVLLLLFVPLNRQLADAHRALSGTILGTPIESPYGLTVTGSPDRVLRSWALDPARWRDYLWTWATITVGWVLSWLALGLSLAVLWYLVFPFVFWVTPDGAFDMYYGIITIDTVEESFLEWIWLPVAFGLWWTLVPVLMRWRAQIDRALLAPVQPAPAGDENVRTTTTDPRGSVMSRPSHEGDPAGRVPGEPMQSRMGLTGLALVYMLLGVPTLVVLVVVTTAVPLSIVVVGLFVMALFLPFNRALANVHRRFAAMVLGVRIGEPYLRSHAKSPIGRVRNWARDPARWRDLAWTYVSVTAGFVLSALTVALLLTVVFYLIFPFLFWVTPDGVFEVNYGLIRIDTVRESFYQWVWAFVALLLWWKFAPVLMRTRARIDRSLLAETRASLERRVAEVSESRAETIDHSAAELRRIERDLHDGAQARLVSLGMSLGMAEQLMVKDPEAAARLLEEARTTTTSALGDLRSVVRGIHPPVLADRGLAGAVQALALDMAIPVAVTVSLPGRPPAPVESAAYFAVAECLANIGKHSGARRAGVELAYADGTITITVEDDGRGGADQARGTGLAGVARRLGAFDGTIGVESPTGGPTIVTMELPCVLSSPKTSPSSGTD